jgi:hypothetical protein
LLVENQHTRFVDFNERLVNDPKAMEKVMKDQIVLFCNERGLLNRFPSGFRSGHSTNTALLKITDDIGMDMDNNLMSILVLLDFLRLLILSILNFCVKIENFFQVP